MHLELSKQTTILLTLTLYERITAEAKRRSMSDVVREACELRYGFGASDVPGLRRVEPPDVR